MLPIYFSDVYRVYDDPNAPVGDEIIGNTNYPNLNATEYRIIPDKKTIRMNPIWEAIGINSRKQIIIGTNKTSGCEWSSSLYSFDNIENVKKDISAFNLYSNELITNIEYLTDELFLATFRNGGVELWSSHDKNRRPPVGYCPLRYGRSNVHTGVITCLELMSPIETKAITGGDDLTLQLWDIGEDELTPTTAYRFAHNDAITGISHMKIEESLFATCSRDKSVLMWDLRMVRPALALFTDHDCGFEGAAWVNSSQNSTTLGVGDANGSIHTVDCRSFKKFIHSEKVFKNPVRKILSNGEKLAVIGDTTTVKIFCNAIGRIIYQNDKHAHFVRDGVWYNSTKLLTVGSDSKMREHNITC